MPRRVPSKNLATLPNSRRSRSPDPTARRSRSDDPGAHEWLSRIVGRAGAARDETPRRCAVGAVPAARRGLRGSARRHRHRRSDRGRRARDVLRRRAAARRHHRDARAPARVEPGHELRAPTLSAQRRRGRRRRGRLRRERLGQPLDRARRRGAGVGVPRRAALRHDHARATRPAARQRRAADHRPAQPFRHPRPRTELVRRRLRVGDRGRHGAAGRLRSRSRDHRIRPQPTGLLRGRARVGARRARRGSRHLVLTRHVEQLPRHDRRRPGRGEHRHVVRGEDAQAQLRRGDHRADALHRAHAEPHRSHRRYRPLPRGRNATHRAGRTSRRARPTTFASTVCASGARCRSSPT